MDTLHFPYPGLQSKKQARAANPLLSSFKTFHDTSIQQQLWGADQALVTENHFLFVILLTYRTQFCLSYGTELHIVNRHLARRFIT